MGKKKIENNEELKSVDVVDVLLDPDNKDPIVLIGENGKEYDFEQIAVIPYEVNGVKRLYCVLKPLDQIDGIEDDEAVVFYVDYDEDGHSFLLVEENVEISKAIFERYYELLNETLKEDSKN